jgi:CDP-4-dehydro-6-deoxyglucose reductase
VTDLTVEAAEAHGGADLPRQEIEARVRQVTCPNDAPAILRLRTPDTQRLRFLAGQSVTLALPGGEEGIDLPLASCPCDGQSLEFHLARAPGSAFADAVFAGRLQPDQPVTVTGPSGDFVLGENGTDPILFLAHGIGFAPIKSLIETAISIDEAEAYHLYWAVDAPGQHYMHSRCRSWRDALHNFHYTPLILPADASAPDQVSGLDRATAELGELAGHTVYAAGPPAFLAAVTPLCAARGVPDDRLHTLPTA